MKVKASRCVISIEKIEDCIYIIRGQKVILDQDLAALYGVPTKRLNEQVWRNRAKFPADFMFQLNQQEFENLIFLKERWVNMKEKYKQSLRLCASL